MIDANVTEETKVVMIEILTRTSGHELQEMCYHVRSTVHVYHLHVFLNPW